MEKALLVESEYPFLNNNNNNEIIDEMLKILIAEDDENLGNLLRDYLVVKDCQPVLCRNGKEAAEEFKKQAFDLCIFDIMMPEKDGLSLAREIRKKDTKTPIIFLTAKSMKEDVIKGFESGADDYITKPFSMEILQARMEAILRRVDDANYAMRKKKEFEIGEYTFYPEKRIISKEDGTKKKLTSKESELLRLLCVNKGNILGRGTALQEIWGDDNYFNSRSMDVYITKLRKLFKEDENIEIINSHGKGFKLLVD